MSFDITIFASIVAAGGACVLFMDLADFVVKGDHEKAVFDQMNEMREEQKLPPIEWEEYKEW